MISILLWVLCQIKELIVTTKVHMLILYPWGHCAMLVIVVQRYHSNYWLFPSLGSLYGTSGNMKTKSSREEAFWSDPFHIFWVLQTSAQCLQQQRVTFNFCETAHKGSFLSLVLGFSLDGLWLFEVRIGRISFQLYMYTRTYILCNFGEYMIA